MLSDVVLYDSVYGAIGGISGLPAGETFTIGAQYMWLPGQHENTVTATATFDIYTVSATDVAHYLGLVYDEPAILLAKYVSPDGGATWVSAPVAPGPTILSNQLPAFKVVVTNVGNIMLTNVTIADSVYGPVGSVPSLNPGQLTQFFFTVPWAAGQQTNLATVNAEYEDGEEGSVGARDTANYLGVTATVGVSLKKYVSPDGGTSWVEATTAPGPTIPSDIFPKFKFIITNTGNTPLTDILLTDSVYGTIAVLTSMAPGEEDEYEITAPWEEGLHENIATFTATAYDESTLTATANAFYTGPIVPRPSIQIIKYVSVDGGLTWIDANTAPGPLLPAGTAVMFQYVITNTGNVPLSNIVVTDDVLGVIGTVPTLAVGETQSWTVTPI